jgi:hypothetical protein
MSRLIELKKARLVELNRADGIVKQTEAATFRSEDLRGIPHPFNGHGA